ncbi:MAG: metal ABC transporter substrate-binding protein [Lachnospiraceae bacterium]|nr:metal ABC transporter substrate-binding protein [Lachnospiraceae bacterium]
MSNKYVYSFVMLAVITVILAGITGIYRNNTKEEKKAAQENITVITSFYPMYIAADNLLQGVDGVTLQNLSEPQTGCLHDFQLTPEDMKLLSTADVFVINGSGAETFIADVIKQYPKLKVIDATKNFENLSSHIDEETAMHAWMDPYLYGLEIKNISDGLKGVLKEQETELTGNEKTYLSQIKKLQNRVKSLRQTLKGRDVILFSEAYLGFADTLGLNNVYLMDLDEERQVSSGEVAKVMNAIEESKDVFVLAEDPYGKDLGTTVKKERDVEVLYIDTLTRGDYNRHRYVEGMQANLDLIKELIERETH